MRISECLACVSLLAYGVDASRARNPPAAVANFKEAAKAEAAKVEAAVVNVAKSNAAAVNAAKANVAQDARLTTSLNIKKADVSTTGSSTTSSASSSTVSTTSSLSSSAATSSSSLVAASSSSASSSSSSSSASSSSSSSSSITSSSSSSFASSSSTATSTTSSNSTTTSYAAAATITFNAKSENNLAVYFGSTNETGSTTLTNLCSNADIDIVILTFVTSILSGGGGYPAVDFTELGCSGQSSEMEAANATGLVWCPTLAEEITTCQSLGRKVLLSLGGSDGNITFDSATQANESAAMVWNIFGAGTAYNTSLRPFGDSVVDGFDIDNESGVGTYWSTFVAHLRTLFATETDKTFYLSAAPGCYYPSADAPLAMLTEVDFVWPQFYDATTCGVSTSGFEASIKAWSKRLNTGNKPSLLIGALSFDDGTGYEAPDTFADTILDVQDYDLTNFGGVMLWDGPYGLITTNSAGEDYINVTKTALNANGGDTKIQDDTTGTTNTTSDAAIVSSSRSVWLTLSVVGATMLC